LYLEKTNQTQARSLKRRKGEKMVSNEWRKALIFRWAFLAVIVVGLFWTIWWLVTGEMPEADKIVLTKGEAIFGLLSSGKEVVFELPCVAPRILDAIFAGIVIAGIIALYTSEMTSSYSKDFGKISLPLEEDLGFSVVEGLMWGLVFGGNIWMVFGSFFGLVVGLGVVLINALTDPIVGLSYALFTGLVIGLFFGSFPGLLTILFFVLVVALFAVLNAGIQWSRSHDFRRRFGNFMMVRDKNN
jgi:hypothetical protein